MNVIMCSIVLLFKLWRICVCIIVKCEIIGRTGNGAMGKGYVGHLESSALTLSQM